MRMQTNRFTPRPFRSPLESLRAASAARRCRFYFPTVFEGDFHSIQTGNGEEPAVRRVSDTPTVVPAVAYGVNATMSPIRKLFLISPTPNRTKSRPLETVTVRLAKRASGRDQDDQDNIQR